MFKHVLLLVFIIITSYYIVEYYLLYTYTLTVDKQLIKIPLTEKDKFFFKNHSVRKEDNSFDKCLFYTTKIWMAKNGNYIYIPEKDKYLIIEPGYYYYTTDQKVVINSNKDIFEITHFDKVNFI